MLGALRRTDRLITPTHFPNLCCRYNISLGFAAIHYLFHLAVLAFDLLPGESRFRESSGEVLSKRTNGPDFGIVLIDVCANTACGLVLLFAWFSEPLGRTTAGSVFRSVRGVARRLVYCTSDDARFGAGSVDAANDTHASRGTRRVSIATTRRRRIHAVQGVM